MLVFISDMHLADYVWRYKPMAGDAYYSWRQIQKYITTSRPEAVFILGDALNSKTPKSRAAYELLAGIQNIAHICPIYAIEGQHDRSDPPWFELAHMNSDTRNVQHLGLEPVSVGGYRIAGIDQTPGSELKQVLEHISDDIDILCLHQVVSEFIGGAGAFGIKDLPAVPLIISGDYHNAVTFKGTKEQDVVYIGSTCMQNIGENPDKSFVSLVDGRIERIPLKTRSVVKAHVKTADDLRSLVESIKSRTAAGDNPQLTTLVHVEYPKDLAAFDVLTAVCKSQGYYLWTAPYLVEAEKKPEARPDSSFESLAEQELGRGPELDRLLEVYRSDNARRTIAQLRPPAIAELIDTVSKTQYTPPVQPTAEGQ